MNILILSATTGGGHMRAANAIKGYVEEKGNGYKVKVIDTIENINPLLNATITNGYVCLAKKTPRLYGKIYKLTDESRISLNLVNKINKIFSKKLIPIINDFETDIIITTHPFSTAMVSTLKGEGHIRCPIICVMTDYAPHNTWINTFVDSYIVSNDDMKADMVKLGVESEKVFPFGIPIDKKFQISNNCNTKMSSNIKSQLPTILMMAGSFGVENILSIYKSINSLELKFKLIVITGKNERLYEKISNLIENDTKDTELIYFTNEVYKYMSIADILITKPGGLTITEAINFCIPMILFDAIPGQEEENAEFLVKNNIAIKIDAKNKCKDILKDLLTNRSKLNNMKKSCELVRKDSSNKNILGLIEYMVRKNTY